MGHILAKVVIAAMLTFGIVELVRSYIKQEDEEKYFYFLSFTIASSFLGWFVAKKQLGNCLLVMAPIIVLALLGGTLYLISIRNSEQWQTRGKKVFFAVVGMLFPFIVGLIVNFLA